MTDLSLRQASTSSEIWHKRLIAQHRNPYEMFNSLLRVRGAFELTEPHSDMTVDGRFSVCESAVKESVRDLLNAQQFQEFKSCYAVVLEHRDETINFVEPVMADQSSDGQLRHFFSRVELLTAFSVGVREAMRRLEEMGPSLQSYTVVFGGRLQNGPWVIQSIRFSRDDDETLSSALNNEWEDLP